MHNPSPEDQIFELRLRLMRARLVQVFAELRIVDFSAAGQQSVPGTYAPLLDRFLRACANIGLFTTQPDGTRRSRRACAPGGTSALRSKAG